MRRKNSTETKHDHNDSQNSHRTAFLHSHLDVLCVSFSLVWAKKKKKKEIKNQSPTHQKRCQFFKIA